MSIKKSQAILKRFIDLKSGVWFTPGSETETMFCDTWNFFLLSSVSSFRFPFPLSSFPTYLGTKDRSKSVSRVNCRSQGRLAFLNRHMIVSE